MPAPMDTDTPTTGVSMGGTGEKVGGGRKEEEKKIKSQQGKKKKLNSQVRAGEEINGSVQEE